MFLIFRKCQSWIVRGMFLNFRLVFLENRSSIKNNVKAREIYLLKMWTILKEIKVVTQHISKNLAKPGKRMVPHFSKLKWRTYYNAGEFL